MKHRLSLLLILFLVFSLPLQAQRKKSAGEVHRMSGLYLTVDAGLLIPNSKQANFYSGRPGNTNTIKVETVR
jgi:hypothetical protein